MSTYVICTQVPVFRTIEVDSPDPSDYEPDEKVPEAEATIVSVIVDDSAIPGTVRAVLAQGGKVEDENGLEVKPEYSDGTKDPDWDLMAEAYDHDTWPAWSFGF